MTVSWWTVYLLDQLSRRVSGNDKREGNQYYNVLPSLLKMGLMTGRASRTHIQPDSQRGHLCACSFMGMRVCKIKSSAYLHPRDISRWNHTQAIKHTEHTESELGLTDLAMYNNHGTEKPMFEFWEEIAFVVAWVHLSSLNSPFFLSRWHLSSKLHASHKQGHRVPDFVDLPAKPHQHSQNQDSPKRGSKNVDTRHFFPPAVLK